MSKRKEKSDMLEIFEKFKNGEITGIGKLLGRGAFGEVRDIIFKNKTAAGKLIKRESNEITEEEKFSQELRGQNIIKINKIYTKEIKDEWYDLVIMEKAILRDLGKLNEFYHGHNLLKLINEPFDEAAGDNLLRFYSKQIISALEILDRNYYIHFDLKPENLLITINLVLKLTDFSLLKKVQDKDNNIKIPGGTPGYLSPEYYIERNVSPEDARKQDYFALGSTLFFLKYGFDLLKYKKSEDKIIIANQIIDSLQKNISYIKSQKITDKDFVDFLCSLISYRPKDRPSFEQIYRNKWLNKDSDKLEEILYGFENDEDKLIMELQKNDYLIKKEKDLNINQNYEKDNQNNLNQEEKEKIKISLENKKKNDNNPCRFRFKKKKKQAIE
jgi:serine/threonine protein kinase